MEKSTMSTPDSENFVKFIRSPESKLLRENYPNAFLLLSLIAERARRYAGHPDGLQIGDAILGDFKAAGLTRSKYRTAIKKLEKLKHIEIIWNGKKFRKTRNLTINLTIKSTLVNLLSSTVWDINSEQVSQHVSQHVANRSPTDRHKQERIRKNKKEEEEDIIYPPLLLIERAKGVFISEDNHLKLVAEFGAEFVQEGYIMLSVWKSEQNPNKIKKYNDYLAFRRWVVKALRKDKIDNAELDQREKRLGKYAIATPVDEEENKKNALKIESGWRSPIANISAGPRHLEVVTAGAHPKVFQFEYNKSTFKEEVTKCLREQRFEKIVYNTENQKIFALCN